MIGRRVDWTLQDFSSIRAKGHEPTLPIGASEKQQGRPGGGSLTRHFIRRGNRRTEFLRQLRMARYGTNWSTRLSPPVSYGGDDEDDADNSAGAADGGEDEDGDDSLDGDAVAGINLDQQRW